MLLMLAAFLGDNTDYWIGRHFGPRIFNSDSPLPIIRGLETEKLLEILAAGDTVGVEQAFRSIVPENGNGDGVGVAVAPPEAPADPQQMLRVGRERRCRLYVPSEGVERHFF